MAAPRVAATHAALQATKFGRSPRPTRGDPAHNYQRPEVQDRRRFCRRIVRPEPRSRRHPTYVFCVCALMARTARCCRRKRQCPSGSGGLGGRSPLRLDADQLRAWKAEHPGAVVVSYVNTSAEVKARATSATSGNAVEIVNSIPAERDILFLPELFSVRTCRRVTGRENMQVWMGDVPRARGKTRRVWRGQLRSIPRAERCSPRVGCATNWWKRCPPARLPATAAPYRFCPQRA